MQWLGKNNHPAGYCNGIVSFVGHFGLMDIIFHKKSTYFSTRAT
ncbi:hypothetical protein RG47T_4427 [Mucilaginibacter polytrichastri]|uniref:Uncharacterized protein n=1 Tax=Mucilaginibacter polytrichastri TaxID=1302689 RepID=A0A1Q6A4K9_9SPHI|nr:hypothetical protein RG47T_4427 [Mucilaginibacter polytrichastri]